MSNQLSFVGRLAKAPVLINNTTPVCNFTLIRNEYAGKDENGKERPETVVSADFVAFRGQAEAIAKRCFVGDQLFVTAKIRNNNYTDKDNVEHYKLSLIVEDFEFGAPGAAKRDHLEKQNAK